MAHEVESMFYTGNVPWHGLGTELENPPTTRDAITMAGLDWEVGLQPTYSIVEGKQVELPARATIRMSDGKILGVVGERYRPIQNTTAFEWFDPFVESGEVTLETAGSLREGRKVWILGKVQNGRHEVARDDVVDLYVLLSTSHDGSTMTRVGYTPIRVVCANTEHAALSNKSSKLLRVRHTKSAGEALERIRDTMNVTRGEFEASIEQMRAMVRKGVKAVDVEHYVRLVFKPQLVEGGLGEGRLQIFLGDEESEGECKRLVDNILPLFEEGRGNDLPAVRGTAWAAYNAVTEYLTHERGRSADNRLHHLWFGDGRNLNKRAYDLALRMCA